MKPKPNQLFDKQFQRENKNKNKNKGEFQLFHRHANKFSLSIILVSNENNEKPIDETYIFLKFGIDIYFPATWKYMNKKLVN